MDPDDRTGVTHHLATRTGRRIDAHHARTHLTASFSRCVSRLGSGGRVEPKLQREWPSDPGQMVRHKNLMFPSFQVAPLTCARAVAPAVTTPSRHCSRHQQHPEPWWVSSVDLCTSFDVFGLLVYTINHRSLCTVGRGTGADLGLCILFRKTKRKTEGPQHFAFPEISRENRGCLVLHSGNSLFSLSLRAGLGQNLRQN